ncbi:MAG: hypothetical protein JWL70_1896, partial [Acidimicrobiia bacterium]|nr:hypothetical protein [Acidimicrobiia bacterium]
MVNDREPAGAQSRNERLKQIVREARHRSQMVALPSALPGEEDRFIAEPTGLQGLTARGVWVYSEPGTPGPDDRQKSEGEFSATALGPVFVSYGPMLADGDHIFEEWESQMYTSNGTLYNNQYLLVLRFEYESESVAEFDLHQDSDLSNLTYGQLGGRPEPSPSTKPRRPFG